MCRFENLMLNIIKLTKQFPLLTEFSLSFSWLSHGKVCLTNLKLFVLYFPNSANQLTQLLAIIHVHLKTFCDLKVWKNDNLNERLISLDWIFQAYLSPVSWSTLINQTNRYFNHDGGIDFQTRMTVANELIQCDMLPAFYVTHRGRTWSVTE